MLFVADKLNSWVSKDPDPMLNRRFRIQFVQRGNGHSYEVYDREIMTTAFTNNPPGPSLSAAMSFCHRRAERALCL